VHLTKRHGSAQQQVLRAHIVVAAGEGKSHAQIARQMSGSVETVRLWRNRWVALQSLSLKDRGVEER
jgi:transposase